VPGIPAARTPAVPALVAAMPAVPVAAASPRWTRFRPRACRRSRGHGGRRSMHPAGTRTLARARHTGRGYGRGGGPVGRRLRRGLRLRRRPRLRRGPRLCILVPRLGAWVLRPVRKRSGAGSRTVGCRDGRWHFAGLTTDRAARRITLTGQLRRDHAEPSEEQQRAHAGGDPLAEADLLKPGVDGVLDPELRVKRVVIPAHNTGRYRSTRTFAPKFHKIVRFREKRIMPGECTCRACCLARLPGRRTNE
jgi:hypothetical protein